MTRPARYNILNANGTRSTAALHRVLSQVYGALPGVLKFIAAAVFLVNIRSWPLVWHYNVLLRPILDLRLRLYRTLLLALLSPSIPPTIKQPNNGDGASPASATTNGKGGFIARRRSALKEAKAQWFRSICPVGEDPIAYEVRVGAWAGPDECDFNWHLSNSCYPKALDSARFRAALQICPTFFRAGGWMPLGATHFKFIKEIPIFAHYEMRMHIAAWDEKWMYVVVRYVTLPKRGKKSSTSNSKKLLTTDVNSSSSEDEHHKGQSGATKNNNNSSEEKNNSDEEVPSGDAAPFVPALHTPASGKATPVASRSASFVGVSGHGNGFGSGFGMSSISNGSAKTPNGGSKDKKVTETEGADERSNEREEMDLSALVPTAEADGATLHCVSVSELCFKIGRITVPPAVVLAMEGFSRLPDASPSQPQPQTESTPSSSTSSSSSSQTPWSTYQSSPPPGTRYTHTHPPPTYTHAYTLLQSPDIQRGTGDLRTLQRFLRAGWRDVREGERWWEDALGGEVEVKRTCNLGRVRGVRDGMGGAGAVLR